MASVKIDGFVFENCGYLENDEDGFRYAINDIFVA